MAKSCHIIRIVTLAAVLVACVSCVYDEYDTVGGAVGVNTVAVELSIRTHAATGTSGTYVVGSEWENYIDIAGGDYRIYFFTYDPKTETAGNGANSILISEFRPDDIDIYTTDDSGLYTTYRASGSVDPGMAEYEDFKVVMLANWGVVNYPSVTPGTTTIDDICNAGTFGAFVDGSGNAVLPSASLHIPFYGVHEYSGVEWDPTWRTILDGDITLLRAVAKVEVILSTESNDNVSFEDVSIVNYNAQGYCAPSGVYMQRDYDHNYNWDTDYVDGLHLVSKDSGGDGINDPDQSGHTFTLYKTTNSDGLETWVCYLPEYYNMGTDFSYISVKFDFQASAGEPYSLYFGNYHDGTCNAYGDGGDTNDRYDIFRNYLYRFTVSLGGTIFQVHVDKWEDTHENDFTFTEDETYTDSEGDDSGGGPYGTDPD